MSNSNPIVQDIHKAVELTNPDVVLLTFADYDVESYYEFASLQHVRTMDDGLCTYNGKIVQFTDLLSHTNIVDPLPFDD